MNQISSQHFELTNLAMGLKGSCFQYDSKAEVVGLSAKFEQVDANIEEEVTNSIWLKIDDKNGYVTIDEAKKFSLRYFEVDHRF